jgi:hypothetical protein
MRQATSPLQALQRTYISELRGTMFVKLYKPRTRFCHRVAHPSAHPAKPCEIYGIVPKILRFENVRDDEVVGKARDGFLRVGLLRLGHERCARASGRALGSASGYLTGHGAPGVVARARSERGPFANVEETVSSDQEILSN